MIKEITDISHVIDMVVESKYSTMLMARKQSLICYDTINTVLIKNLNVKVAYKIFSYWVSPYYGKTMSYSLFLSEDEELLVYRVDEYDRIGLAECVMQKQEITDYKIFSRIMLIDGIECKEVLKNFYQIKENINENLKIEALDRKIFGEKVFFDFSNFKTTLEFLDPYGCTKLTKVISDFISYITIMTQFSVTTDEFYIEFCC